MTDPEATKRALLDAGRAEFAAYGLAGARTDRVAATSGVNKQRIYAYFGSKEGLFQAVLSDALDSLLGLVPFPEGDLPLEEFLASYVRSVGAYHLEHPQLLRLLQWEALELGPVGVVSDERARFYQEKVSGFAAVLDIPVEDAAPLLFGAIGVAAWPHVMPQLGALILGGENAVSRARRWAEGAAARLAPVAVSAAL